MHQYVKTLLLLLSFFGSLSLAYTQEYEHPSDYAAELMANNKLEQAISYCQKTIDKELKKVPVDSMIVASLYGYKAVCHERLKGEANYLAAVKACEEGIKYCISTEEGILRKARLYGIMANSERRTNYQYRSFKSNLKALELFSSVENPDYDYIISVYCAMSMTSVYNGNQEEAKRFLRQAEDIYNKNKSVVDSRRASSYSGPVASYESILSYYKIYQLTELGKSRKDSISIIKTLEKFEKLSKTSNFSKNREFRYYTASLNEVADWYASRRPEKDTSEEDLKQAISLVNKAIDLAQKHQGNVPYNFNYNRCKFFFLLNRLEEAALEIESIIKTTDYTSVNTSKFFSLKGLIQVRQNKKDSALSSFRIAIQKIHQGETALKEDFSNFEPSKIFSDNATLHSIAKELIIRYPNDKSVKKFVSDVYKISLQQFEASYDKRKYNKRQDLYLRRIFKGLINTKRWGYNEDLTNPYLLNRFETIRNELVWSEFYQNRKTDNLEGLEKLLSEKRLLLTEIAEAQNENKIKVQDSLKTLLELVENKISDEYPNANLLREINFRVEELQQKLSENQFVLKYILLEEELVIIQVAKDKINIELIEWKYNEQVEAMRLATLAKNDKILDELSSLLGKVLIPEIDSEYSSLIINPDGILTQLPWEIIKKDDRHLIEDYDIRYTSNLGFIFPKIETKSQEELLAIYTPEYPKSDEKFVTRSSPVYLKGAQNEASIISNYFPSRIYNDNLTKTLFKQTAPQASLLHLAMHAEINTTNSGLNRLLFDGDSDSDKHLTLEEIYGMKMSANLAVLSACNTGFGNDNDGRGMESFQRAFTFAGVPTTVASLWEVPDLSTEKIMVNFYKNLKKGQSKSQALKNAKVNFVDTHKGTKLEQPYYWAGFVVYGDDKPIVEVSNSWIWFVGGFLFLGLLLILIKILKKSIQS